MLGDQRTTLPFDAPAGPQSLSEAMFVPQRYEPNYAYPLLMMLHGRGGDEHQLIRLMPALSWRNYVAMGLRGPELVIRRGREEGYCWGPAFVRPGRRPPQTVEDGAEVLRRRLQTGVPDPVEVVEEGVFEAVRRARRAVHVHSERIFLVGCGEGAAAAYRLGLSYPERFAGVVALNGWLPGGFRPLARMKACRDLRILVIHGEWNARAPIEQARREVGVLRAAGLRVAFQAYPCAHRLTSRMLSDVDNWLINQCTASV